MQGKLVGFSISLLSLQVLGAVGTLPEIYTELEISYFLLRRLLGVRTEGDKKGAKVCSRVFNTESPGTQASCSSLRHYHRSFLT